MLRSVFTRGRLALVAFQDAGSHRGHPASTSVVLALGRFWAFVLGEREHRAHQQQRARRQHGTGPLNGLSNELGQDGIGADLSLEQVVVLDVFPQAKDGSKGNDADGTPDESTTVLGRLGGPYSGPGDPQPTQGEGEVLRQTSVVAHQREIRSGSQADGDHQGPKSTS